FRLVERMPVGDRHAGDDEGTEAEELRDDEPQVLLLVFDDVAQVERAGLGHDAHQRQAEEHLVGQGLGRGAQGAEQGELVGARPAGEQHGIDRQAGHGKEEQDADVQVGHPQVGVMGTMAKAISSALMATTGARVKISRSAKSGVQSSLKNIFSMSAASWNMPN